MYVFFVFLMTFMICLNILDIIGIKLEPVYKGHLSITVTFVRSIEWPL